MFYWNILKYIKGKATKTVLFAFHTIQKQPALVCSTIVTSSDLSERSKKTLEYFIIVVRSRLNGLFLKDQLSISSKHAREKQRREWRGIGAQINEKTVVRNIGFLSHGEASRFNALSLFSRESAVRSLTSYRWLRKSEKTIGARPGEWKLHVSVSHQCFAQRHRFSRFFVKAALENSFRVYCFLLLRLENDSSFSYIRASCVDRHRDGWSYNVQEEPAESLRARWAIASNSNQIRTSWEKKNECWRRFMSILRSTRRICPRETSILLISI